MPCRAALRNDGRRLEVIPIEIWPFLGRAGKFCLLQNDQKIAAVYHQETSLACRICL